MHDVVGHSSGGNAQACTRGCAVPVDLAGVQQQAEGCKVDVQLQQSLAQRLGLIGGDSRAIHVTLTGPDATAGDRALQLSL